MKRILLILSVVFMSFSSICFAESDQEIVDSFKEHVNGIMQPIIDSYNFDSSWVTFHEKQPYVKGSKDFWSKCSLELPTFRVDVKKTDSLISPYIGELIGTQNCIEYAGKYNSENEAKTANIVENIRFMRSFKFIYAYQEGQWVKTQTFYMLSFDKYYTLGDNSYSEFDRLGNKHK